MSFYSYKNANADACPGAITGSPLDGICEKICVQVKNVYDACLQQEQLDDREVTVTNIVPVLSTGCGAVDLTRPCRCECNGNQCNCKCGACGEITYQDALENAEQATCLPQPYGNWTFESCRSSTTEGAITNLSVDRLCDRPQFARVKGDVSIPIDVLFIDQRCQEWMGQATVRVTKDVLLAIPDESIVPFTIESLVSAICVSGRYIGNCRFEITICVTIVLKILAQVEVMIPSYGFCDIPPCEEFAESVCDEFFSLPIFPRSCACQQNGTTNGTATVAAAAAGTTNVNGCSFYTGGKPFCQTTGTQSAQTTGTCASCSTSISGFATGGTCCSTCSNCGTSCGTNSTLCPRCGSTMTGTV